MGGPRLSTDDFSESVKDFGSGTVGAPFSSTGVGSLLVRVGLEILETGVALGSGAGLALGSVAGGAGVSPRLSVPR